MVGLNLKIYHHGQEITSVRQLRRIKNADIEGYLLLRILEACPVFVRTILKYRGGNPVPTNIPKYPFLGETALDINSILEELFPIWSNASRILLFYLRGILIYNAVELAFERTSLMRIIYVPSYAGEELALGDSILIQIRGGTNVSEIKQFLSDNQELLTSLLPKLKTGNPRLGLNITPQLERNIEIMLLRNIEELSFSQIAEIKGLTEDSAKRGYHHLHSEQLPRILPETLLKVTN